MQVSIIAAIDRNQLIGRDGELPWRLPADLKYFKRMTIGKPIVMGRRTWQSLDRPLPGRPNIVLTRNAEYKPDGAIVVRDLDQALAVFSDAPELMIIGGGQLYRSALPIANRLYLTRIDDEFEGDAWFPRIDWPDWNLVSEQSHPSDEINRMNYNFQVYQRQTENPDRIS